GNDPARLAVVRADHATQAPTAVLVERELAGKAFGLVAEGEEDGVVAIGHFAAERPREARRDRAALIRDDDPIVGWSPGVVRAFARVDHRIGPVPELRRIAVLLVLDARAGVRAPLALDIAGRARSALGDGDRAADARLAGAEDAGDVLIVHLDVRGPLF